MSRIVTNTSANLVYMYYENNNAALSSALEKLSSGLRINRASDDPAGLAISEFERLQIIGANTAVNVIANANNYINTADGYLQTVNDMLGQMEQLAVSYNDSTKSTQEKTDLATEFSALYAEMSNMDTQATFNGVTLFKTTGAASNVMTFQVGADSNDTFTMAPSGTITALVATGGALTISNLAQVSNATAQIATTRANLGASQVQLNYISTAQMTYSTNISAAEARIRDVDVAQESIIFAKEQILVQSSTAMLAQANAISQNVLTLLR